MERGFVKFHRQTIESAIWRKPPLYLKVWLYLLSQAQYKDYKSLKRGQLFTSIPEIRDACWHKVGRRIVKPSKKNIFDIIAWLRNPDSEDISKVTPKVTSIVTSKVTHGILVTIDDYCVYQGYEKFESNAESNAESNNINKEFKERKNKEKRDDQSTDRSSRSSYSFEFESFWKEYPKKVGKKKAYSFWLTRMNELKKNSAAPAEDLVRAARNYCSYCKDNDQYFMHPSRFLDENLEYEDYLNYKSTANREEQIFSARVRNQEIGEWMNSGRDPDDPAMEDWIKRGANLKELYRQED